MNRYLYLRSPRIRHARPSWADLFVERADDIRSDIDVEWLAMDETIVLESGGDWRREEQLVGA